MRTFLVTLAEAGESVECCRELMQDKLGWQVHALFKFLAPSGVLSPSDLLEFCRREGVGATESEVLRLVDEYDKDRDGLLSVTEFCGLCLPPTAPKLRAYRPGLLHDEAKWALCAMLEAELGAGRLLEQARLGLHALGVTPGQALELLGTGSVLTQQDIRDFFQQDGLPAQQAEKCIARLGDRVTSKRWGEQVQPALFETRLTEQYLQRHTQPCPGCGIRVQRAGDATECPTVHCKCGEKWQCTVLCPEARRESVAWTCASPRPPATSPERPELTPRRNRADPLSCMEQRGGDPLSPSRAQMRGGFAPTRFARSPRSIRAPLRPADGAAVPLASLPGDRLRDIEREEQALRARLAELANARKSLGEDAKVAPGAVVLRATERVQRALSLVDAPREEFKRSVWAPQATLDRGPSPALREVLNTLLEFVALDDELEERSMNALLAIPDLLEVLYALLDPGQLNGCAMLTDWRRVAGECGAECSYEEAMVLFADARRHDPLDVLGARSLGLDALADLCWPVSSRERRLLGSHTTPETVRSVLYLSKYTAECPQCGSRVQRLRLQGCPQVSCVCGTAFECDKVGPKDAMEIAPMTLNGLQAVQLAALREFMRACTDNARRRQDLRRRLAVRLWGRPAEEILDDAFHELVGHVPHLTVGLLHQGMLSVQPQASAHGAEVCFRRLDRVGLGRVDAQTFARELLQRA